jgi:hypothetical protein
MLQLLTPFFTPFLYFGHKLITQANAKKNGKQFLQLKNNVVQKILLQRIEGLALTKTLLL